MGSWNDRQREEEWRRQCQWQAELQRREAERQRQQQESWNRTQEFLRRSAPYHGWGWGHNPATGKYEYYCGIHMFRH